MPRTISDAPPLISASTSCSPSSSAVLLDVRELHRRADLDLARVRLLLAQDQLEQRRLARAVGADDADDRALGHLQAQVAEERLVAEPLGDALDLDHLVAEFRAGGDLDGRGVVAHGAGFARDDLRVLDQPGARQVAALLAVHADPRQLVLQRAHARRLLRAFLPLLRHDPAELLLQPAGVVALVRNAAPGVELQDPLRHVVQEVAVMRDDDHRAGILLELLLEPVHRLGIEVVGRLVEQEQVGLFEDRLAERHAALLAAAERADDALVVGQEQRVGGLLELAVQAPSVHRVNLVLQLGHAVHRRLHLLVGERLGHAVGDGIVIVNQLHDLAERALERLADGQRRVEQRVLQHDPRLVAARDLRLALKIAVQGGHDAQHGGLAGPVLAHDPDLGAGIEAEVDILEHLLLAVILVQAEHREDELLTHAKRTPVLSQEDSAQAVATSEKNLS